MRDYPYRDCSTEYQCDECSETFTCSSAEEREARLRALLDERTALLRECEAEFDRVWTKQAQDLSRRIRAALETTCDS